MLLGGLGPVGRARVDVDLAGVDQHHRCPEPDVDHGQPIHDHRADGADVGLTANEFNVLAFLISRRGSALTRDQIADAALPHDGDRQARTVDSHVSHLRRKLGDAGQRIRTVWGIGYRFDPEDAS